MSGLPRLRRYTRKGGAAIVARPPALCQCIDHTTGKGCTKEAVDGTLFCQEHQGCPGSPRSGYEPAFLPERYNGDPAVYRSHNCYAYSMNVLDPKLVRMCRRKNGNGCRKSFHQPGALNGDRFALNSAERRSCEVVERLQKADVPGIERSDFYSTCPVGKSKIALVVDPGEDYHYYRQDADGMWSHKDGSNKVKRFDALKNPIFNPATAARDYRWQNSDLNYEDFCGFYCVPRDQEVRLGQGGGVLVSRRSASRPKLQGARKETRKVPQRSRKVQRMSLQSKKATATRRRLQ